MYFVDYGRGSFLDGSAAFPVESRAGAAQGASRTRFRFHMRREIAFRLRLFAAALSP